MINKYHLTSLEHAIMYVDSTSCQYTQTARYNTVEYSSGISICTCIYSVTMSPMISVPVTTSICGRPYIPYHQRTRESCDNGKWETKAQEIWPVPLNVCHPLVHYPTYWEVQQLTRTAIVYSYSERSALILDIQCSFWYQQKLHWH